MTCLPLLWDIFGTFGNVGHRYAPPVSIPAETFWIFAIALLAFGTAFVVLGLSSERNYWSQRDPSGNAKKDATKFAAVYANAFKYAAGEYRAPLRIAAIGVIQWYLAAVCAIVAILFGV